MSGRRFWARRKLLALGFMMLMPVAISVAARTAAASGYSVTAGITGEPICNPGGEDDCPQ